MLPVSRPLTRTLPPPSSTDTTAVEAPPVSSQATLLLLVRGPLGTLAQPPPSGRCFSSWPDRPLASLYCSVSPVPHTALAVHHLPACHHPQWGRQVNFQKVPCPFTTPQCSLTLRVIPNTASLTPW